MSGLPGFAILIFRFVIIWPIGNLLLRFTPTYLALAVMKRLHFDVRAAWDMERLNFLSCNSISNSFKMKLLFFWSLLTRPGLGIAWGCAMESSYRIYALCWFAYGPGKPSLTQKQISRVKALVQREVTFVQGNLETHSFNNHYAFNVFSLLIANAVVGPVEDAKLVAELGRILRDQFLPDGTNFEASSSYHLLVLEAIARLVILRPDLRMQIKSSMNLDGALAFVQCVAPRGKLIWRIGDTDGSCVINDGISVVELMVKAGVVSIPSVAQAKYFENFSAIFFDQSPLKFALWMPHPGQNGRGGHNHADALTLTCAIDGREVIGDPGIPLYSFMRNWFRSACNHSGPFPSGIEPLREAGAFKTTDHWVGSLYRLSSEHAVATCERVIGEGYSRSVKLIPTRGVEVEDTSIGCMPIPSPRLVLDPGYKVSLETPLRARLSRLDRKGPVLIIEALEGIDSFGLRTSFYARSYFRLSRTTVLEINAFSSNCRWRVSLQ